jgi:hypothetical protein
MSEFEDRLNSILSSPEEMEKILNIARSFSGSVENEGGTQQQAAPAGDPSGSLGSISSALSGMDPKMLGMLGRLMSEYSSGGNDKTTLLEAMKPYVRESRYSQIERAAQIAKLARIARVAFSEFSGGGFGV